MMQDLYIMPLKLMSLFIRATKSMFSNDIMVLFIFQINILKMITLSRLQKSSCHYYVPFIAIRTINLIYYSFVVQMVKFVFSRFYKSIRERDSGSLGESVFLNYGRRSLGDLYIKIGWEKNTYFITASTFIFLLVSSMFSVGHVPQIM